MSLKIVLGGTTGAADGTLVSTGGAQTNPIQLGSVALNTAIDAHVRADDDTYSPDQTLAVPAGVEVSFDGGSTWLGSGTNPNAYGADIGDLNVAVKIRQTTAAGSSTGSLTTDGSFTAATALADVTSFVVTPGATQNALTWAAVTNRTRYQVDRATNSGFTTGVVLGIYTGTGTSVTDTGLTNGTTYYYRIKAVGTGRYKDSASFATGNGAPFASGTVLIASDFSVESGDIAGDTLGGTAGTLGAATWAQVSGSDFNSSPLKAASGHVYCDGTGDSGYVASPALSVADYDVELDVSVVNTGTATSSEIGVLGRALSAAATGYFASVTATHVHIYKVVAGTYTLISSDVAWSPTNGTVYRLKLEMRGTAIKAYIDGTLKASATDSTITAAGQGGVYAFGRVPTDAGWRGDNFAVKSA